ncbi:MAG TPA: acyl-CoA dehydrogenase family protein, partial [Vicinamibacteria bacterium]|nr:acyl-CoA dehydrogenase family protein [Vicinamibacteria bacterium]
FLRRPSLSSPPPRAPEVSERESLKVAEASRQKEWTAPSVLRELFLGDFRVELLDPYPLLGEDRPRFAAFYREFKRFLAEEVDSAEIDRSGEYPPRVIERLREMGAFGMKIPEEYGGLGFTNVEYARIMQLLGSADGNIVALLSAHQSIGVPNPLKHFGTPELKKKYLPRCAKGDISAFALTEPHVGSDPARLSTTAVKTPDGSAYVLNGTKLWCTNGTIAKLLVVMAVQPETKKISAFVVETAWPGVSVEHRSRFMGLRALANGVIKFEDVRVPAENLIGQEGKGLRIALTTLNDGRLSIPSGSVGTAKACLEICRKWAAERVQWGKPVGKHEAIAQMLAAMAAHTYAMESVALLAAQMSDRGNYDIRLEAAAAKEWNTARCWEIVDDTMQIRGGRGYETEQSLRERGEAPIPVERIMRDYRINRIFEGSSEIMHLFMAREMVDKHLEVAGPMADPDATFGDKLRAFPKMAAFYAWWYPTRWLGWGWWPRYAAFGPRLARHLRFVERMSRKLARGSFHGMLVYQARLQNKQAFLFRLVDVANELFAMAASATRAHALVKAGRPEAPEAVKLADVFCKISRRRVRALFDELWHNDDVAKYRASQDVLSGRHAWLETGIMGLDQLPPADTEPDTAQREETRVGAA